jgi:hypothetical protein
LTASAVRQRKFWKVRHRPRQFGAPDGVHGVDLIEPVPEHGDRPTASGAARGQRYRYPGQAADHRHASRGRPSQPLGHRRP